MVIGDLHDNHLPPTVGMMGVTIGEPSTLMGDTSPGNEGSGQSGNIFGRGGQSHAPLQPSRQCDLSERSDHS